MTLTLASLWQSYWSLNMWKLECSCQMTLTPPSLWQSYLFRSQVPLIINYSINVSVWWLDFVSRCLDICCNGGEWDWHWILEMVDETKDADLRDEIPLTRERFWHPYSVLVHCMSSFWKKRLLSGTSHFDQGPCYFVLQALLLMPLPPCVKGTTPHKNFFPKR